MLPCCGFSPFWIRISPGVFFEPVVLVLPRLALRPPIPNTWSFPPAFSSPPFGWAAALDRVSSSASSAADASAALSSWSGVSRIKVWGYIEVRNRVRTSSESTDDRLLICTDFNNYQEQLPGIGTFCESVRNIKVYRYQSTSHRWALLVTPYTLHLTPYVWCTVYTRPTYTSASTKYSIWYYTRYLTVWIAICDTK